MSFQLANPFALTALAGIAAFLMTYAGVAKKRLTIRTDVCRVCGRTRSRCTCRWL